MKKILLVVSLVSVLLLAGCNKEEKVNGNVPVVIDNQQQEEVENSQSHLNNNIVEKIDNSKNIVYSIYTQDAVVDVNGKIEIPNINMNSEDANLFNEKMNALVKTIQEQRNESTEAIENGNEDWYDGVEYQYFENGNILSLIIEYQRGYGEAWTQYETFNINTKTGNQYHQLDLANTYRGEENLLDTEEFVAKVKEAYINQMEYEVGPNTSSDSVQEMKEEDEKYIADSINKIQLYIRENNKLYYLVEVNKAGNYWKSIELDI